MRAGTGKRLLRISRLVVVEEKTEITPCIYAVADWKNFTVCRSRVATNGKKSAPMRLSWSATNHSGKSLEHTQHGSTGKGRMSRSDCQETIHLMRRFSGAIL